MERSLIWGVRQGRAIALPDGVATPRSFALGARLGNLAFVWNTPVGIEITRADGTQQDVRIVDMTRWALWGLGALTAVTGAQAARHAIQRRVNHG